MTISLHSLRSFEVAARHLSFKQAAAELNCSATAISHQIRSLERVIGHSLFNRHIRRVSLTSEGEELLQTLTPAFQSIDSTVERLIKRQNRYTVTLGAGPLFGSKWLAPRLGQFWQQNPDIDLRIHHSPLPVVEQMSQYDIAVAWGTGDWKSIEFDKLFDVQVTPVMAPEISFTENDSLEPEALLELPLLHYRNHNHWRQWLTSVDILVPARLPGIVFEDANVQLQAAIEGQGIAMGFLPLINDEIAIKRLQRPWLQTVEPIEAYYLLYQSSALRRPAVSRVREWLLALN